MPLNISMSSRRELYADIHYIYTTNPERFKLSDRARARLKVTQEIKKHENIMYRDIAKDVKITLLYNSSKNMNATE